MFYVQNWDSNPQNSAFQTLQQQLVSIKKSLQYYDGSKGAKKDSYLLTELSKIQKFAYIVRDNLDTLASNPGDSSISHFLTHGDVQLMPALENGLKLFHQIEGLVNGKINQIHKEYENKIQEVKDPKYKEFLGKAKNFSSDEATIYGSRCGVAALKVVDIYSKYINPEELVEVKGLENLQRLGTSNARVLNSFKEGIQELRQEIVKSLRDNEHKLYFCFFDNSNFKDVNGRQNPHYGGHAFVIEKTAEDKFRIYQGYLNQYSLKSFLTEELQKHPEGLKDYEDFYKFLKDLQVFSTATKWDHEVNDAYRSCFGVDHIAFLGESFSDDFFKLRFASMKIQDEEFKASANTKKIAVEPSQILEEAKEVIKSAAIGASLGGAVSTALYVSYLATSSLF